MIPAPTHPVILDKPERCCESVCFLVIMGERESLPLWIMWYHDPRKGQRIRVTDFRPKHREYRLAVFLFSSVFFIFLW
jgi:hypothetical protein